MTDRPTRRDFLSTTAAAASAAALAPAASALEQPSGPARFPKDFLWGSSTSAYQVEGAANEDGRGQSIWDEFCRRPGATYLGQSGDVACDHYHRYREDVALMKQIGLRAYRFSVSWPRVIPLGTGALNPKGLDFYSRLIDELLAAGIAPWLTLYHWDTPLALQHRGGWTSPDSSHWFGDYAAVLAKAFSDRVPYWLTMNEPRSFVGSGYRNGEHAPGEKLSLQEVMQVGHNLWLAHGRAVQAIRANAKKPLQVGIAPDCSPSLPASDSPADIELARAQTFAVPREAFEPGRWWTYNAWWFEPAFTGAYPADGLAALGKDAPVISAGDMETIGQPLDFFAINIYGGSLVRAAADGKLERVPFPTGFPYTAMDWQVTPDALYWAPKWLWERYKKPVYITENGLSCRDWVSLDGAVHDPQRIDFVGRYLLALERAMRDGANVRGYFHWSLLDNFEWAQGYKQRFGMIYVDFANQQRRVLKDSAKWFARVIATQGAAITT